MKQEIMNSIIERADEKTKDGVYSHKGYPYAVAKGRLRFVGNFNEILEVCYGFVIVIATVEPYKLKTKIRQMVKELGEC